MIKVMKVPFSVVTVLALLLVTALAQPAHPVQAAGNTCVYVLGTINGRTVTTPAILVPIPDTTVAVDLVRVHVDGTTHQILGYTVHTPGVDAAPEVDSLYVPGFAVEVPSYAATIADLNLDQGQCVSFGVSTPAVPVYVPESALQVPGAVVDAPAIYINVLGLERVVGGQVITVNGRTIVVPGVNTVVPSVTVETPDQSITVDLNGALQTAQYMIPR